MTLIKKQSKITTNNLGHIICLLMFPIFFISHQLSAQESYKLNEIEINRTINSEEEDNLGIPTNPFEIVDRIRRANSMNDATEPSDAIDEAIKSFDMIKEDKKI